MKKESPNESFGKKGITVKRIILFALVLLLLTAAMSACNGQPDDSPAEPVSYFIGDIVDNNNFPENTPIYTVDLPCAEGIFKVEYVNKYLGDFSFKVNGAPADIEFCGISSLQTLDNTLLVATYDTDVTGDYLYIFDIDGKLLLEVHSLDDNGMYLRLGEPAYQIKDNKLIVQGTRMYHGPSLFTGDGKQVELMSDGEYLPVFPDDEVVEAAYEIQYLGNGMFGPITKIETTLTYGQMRSGS